MISAIQEPAASASIVEILAILFGGGGALAVLGQAYMRWRKGPIDDAVQMQQATDAARRASGELFATYKVELEAAKSQLSEYLDNLLKVQRSLGAAEARIEILEKKLRDANAEADQLKRQVARTESLQRELDSARARRTELETELHELQSKVSVLEEKLELPHTK